IAADIKPQSNTSKGRYVLLGGAGVGAVVLVIFLLLSGPPGEQPAPKVKKPEAEKPEVKKEPKQIIPRTPLEKLDRANILAAELLPGLPAELVAILGDHRLRGVGPTSAVSASRDGKLAAVARPGKTWLVDTSTLQPLGSWNTGLVQ